MSARPTVRHAPVGDDRIAYQVLGQGPDLLWVFGTECHLDWMWEHPLQAQQFEDVARFARLILFDRRGTGLSDRVARMSDLDTRGAATIGGQAS